MIVRLDNNSNYIDTLENLFCDTLKKGEIKSKLENNKFTNYLIYLLDEKVVAFINYDIMYERAELININVLEEYQNKKIGSCLIEKMIEDCINNKVNSITLEVRETNENAIHLYKKYGFIEVGVRKGYYQKIDGKLMEKELM